MAVGLRRRGLAKVAIGGVALTALFACGHSHPTAPEVATSNLTVDIGAANIAALLPASGGSPTTVTFANGFATTNPSGATVALTGATTVTFAGTATAPTFTIANGGNTASGTLSFGSCDFHINSTGIAVFAAGNTYKVDPCSVTVNTAGHAVGSSGTLTVTWNFGGFLSATITLPVLIGGNGTVTLGGVVIGTVPVGASTGGTG